jgi:pyruvate/2-oxoglutarate dehydrogenase complex dihydrolipoamide acyltransferase (E2) component
MRRCGRAYCLLLVCLLVTGVTAGGASAAPGGNGNNGKGHAGRGLALAKGHAKHAHAAPQSPPAPVKSTAPSGKDETRREPAPKRVAPKAAPRVDRRASHLTICHRTGSGRYIVISPSVTGAMNGHLNHHDDFVYTGSCTQSAQTPPDDPPATGEHPPRDPASAIGASSLVSPSGDLPFTGGRALYLFLAGSVLIALGLALLRRKPTTY